MKKNIFITGGSSGIGEYLSQHLLSKCEIFCSSRTPSKISGTKYLPCDLCDEHQILDLVSKISNQGIDIFIFNSGIGYFGEFGSISLDQEKEMFDVNFWSNMIFMKNLLPKVSEQVKFIFIGSVAGKSLFGGGVGYQASKFALRGFVGSLRKELGNSVFLINPKIVDTNFYKNSQIIVDEYKKTSLESILAVVENIIDGRQNQWEIDL